MVVAPSSSGINTILDQPPDVMMVGAVGAVFYVNTRHQQCSRMASISRVSLFSDKACTTLVKPTSVVDDLGQSLSGHWSYIHSYVPTCLPNCVLEDSFYKAAFAQSTGVLCAVLHSTEEFSKGWQIRLDANGGVEAASTFFPQLSSLLAESSYGTAVSFGTSPNLVEGKEVFFTRDLTITCSELVGYAGKCRGGDAGLWRLDIAAALAKMLAIEPHMVHVFNTRRLRQDRRLQTVQMLFSVTIRFFVDKPHQAALANSVAAQLEDMQQQYSSLFNQTLINLIAPFNDKNLDVTSLSTFTRSDFGPDFVELPTAAPSTTVVTAAATTTVGLQATPSPGVLTEEDDTGIILGIVFGTFGFMAIFFTVCILCRKKKKVTHPAPVFRGGVSSSGPEAVSVVGKAEVLHDSDEGMAPLSNDAYNSLPGYWNARKDLKPTFEMDFETANRSKKDDLRFDDLMYVSYKNMAHFQDLVSKTYQDIVTQDRLCPNGTHDKTRGGCPCVQVGGDPGLPSDFQVMRVIRVEESGMFNRYVAKREQIRQKRLETDGKTCEAPDPPFFTRDWMASNPDSELCELDDRVNEVYLWHGTQVRTGLQIAMNDFNLTFAGSGAGTMYGKGLYFTESSTKADEYARDEPDGHYDGIRALLLCRVCVGKFYYTQGREPTAIDKYTAGESDSTLGDRAKSVNTYREIVVYNEDQVYPEYLVIYERLHGGARSSPPREDLPFQLELPLYWKTVGKNPYKEGFRKHRVVKHEIVELFQRLADGTCKSSVKVLKVRRIEDSALWCRYINWKRNLSQGLLEEGDKIKAPNELDGNPDSGHVLTEKILAENRGDHAISVENMQPGLNEMLLWHGTSQQAAEAIAEEGFVVADARHGRRFGNGVYLAEDLTKSLDYCKSAANGVNYVLLCRATCGHIYYTEKDWDSGADSPAKAAGCTCVLANPSKKGPREYILFDQSQVYPEYIVEMTRIEIDSLQTLQIQRYLKGKAGSGP